MNKLDDIALWGQLLLLAPLGCVLIAAAITDWKHRKIYNKLTYPSAAVGLVLQTIVFGWSGLLWGFLTVLVVLLLGIPLMIPRWLGAGDIKLFGVIGAVLGASPLFHIFFYSLLAGLVMALSLSLVNGYLGTLLKRVGGFFKGIVMTAATRSNMMQPMEEDERGYLPFAVPILAAFILACTDLYLEWPLILEAFREFSRSLGDVMFRR